MALVDWRTPMEYGIKKDDELNLSHKLGSSNMVVEYYHDGQIPICGAWVTCSGLNSIKERENAVSFFSWAKNKNPLQVLEAALEERYNISGYTKVAHASLLRKEGKIKEAKALIMSL